MGYSLLHQLKKLPHNFTVLIPFQNFALELEKELERKNIKIIFKYSQIVVVAANSDNYLWAQDVWSECKCVQGYDNGLLALKNLDRLGYYYSTEKNSIATKLIHKLKLIPEKRIKFPVKKEFSFKYYIWTAIEDFIIYSAHPKSRYPVGWHEFEEDKNHPPNRAYLKLWEVLATQNLVIDPAESAIEIGASPGGWSWVLSQYFKTVYTFDRADLDPKIQKIPNIVHAKTDAFKIDPKDYTNCSWLFSDLICSPEKIHETIQYWLDHSQIQNYVCTIKFKGQTDYEVIDKLRKIPDSKLVRLYQNKHEVTWIKATR